MNKSVKTLFLIVSLAFITASIVLFTLALRDSQAPLQPKADTAITKVRIMTYNVDNEPECVRDSVDIQKARMEKLADSIIASKVDIASLQEVRDRIHNNDGEIVEPNYIDEAKYLRDVLQGRDYPMNLIDSFEPTGEGGFRVITLSRFPATGDRTVFRFGGSGRHSHFVNLNTSLGPLVFVSIHTRYQEAADHIDWLHNEYLPSQFPTDKTRVIIAGDFNASAGGDPFRAYIADYPAFNGRNVDYITAHKTSVFQSAGNPAIIGTDQPTAGFCEGHSDLHWAVLADVKLREGISPPPASPSPSQEPTRSPTVSTAPSSTPQVSVTLANSPIPTRTYTPTRTPTVTPTETPTRTPTSSRTPTPTVTMTPTSTPTITATRTPTPPSVAMCDRACGVCGWRDTTGVCHTTGPLPTLVSTIPVTTVTGTLSQGLGMCCYKTCINNSCKTVSGYGTDSCSTDGASCAVTKAGVLSPTISIYMSTTPGGGTNVSVVQNANTPTRNITDIAQVTGVQGGGSQGSAQGALPSTAPSITPPPPVSGNVGWIMLVFIPVLLIGVAVVF